MRDFVSVTEKLQCGSPVQATASPRSAPASSGRPISASVAVDVVEPVGRDVREHEVLLARQAHVAAEALGEVGERDHLVAADEAEVHRHADVVPAVGLLVHAEVVAGRRQRAAARSPRRCGRGAARSRARMPSGPDVVDHELEPRLDARDAVAQVLAPLVEDRGEHRDRVFLGDPDAEVLRDPRHRREAAADEHAEAFAPSRIAPISAMQLISGAEQASGHAVIAIFSLRGRSE